MRRRSMTLPLLGLLGLLLASAGCKPSDSILVIYVAGPRADDFLPVQLRVTVTAGIDARAFLVPAVLSTDPDTINLPASFTLALDRSHVGPITVSIDALAANHQTIGFGTTMEDHIQIGGQTLITVMLTEGLPPDAQDAGVEADSGQGGASGAAGGAAGRGGASGAGGSRSLDGATD